MNDLFTKPVNVAVSFSNGEQTVEFSGKKAFCKSLTIDRPFDVDPVSIDGRSLIALPRPQLDIEIKMVFAIPADQFSILSQEFFAPHIGQKRVDDCTVQELLFAVRTKLNEQ